MKELLAEIVELSDAPFFVCKWWETPGACCLGMGKRWDPDTQENVVGFLVVERPDRKGLAAFDFSADPAQSAQRIRDMTHVSVSVGQHWHGSDVTELLTAARDWLREQDEADAV